MQWLVESTEIAAGHLAASLVSLLEGLQIADLQRMIRQMQVATRLDHA